MSISNPSNVWREMPEGPGITSGWDGVVGGGGVVGAGLRVGRCGRWWWCCWCWPQGDPLVIILLACSNCIHWLLSYWLVAIVSTGYYPIGL